MDARADAIRAFDPDEPLIPKSDPVEQWLDWEVQANLVGFRTTTEPVVVEVVAVPRADLEVYRLPGAPPEILERFLWEDTVMVPRHPLNRDTSVAWFDAPVSERWTARFTSSRSLAMPGADSGDALFSLKLATDHPHPDFYQPEKTKLREEAVDAVDWVQMIAQIDEQLGPLQHSFLVTEILVVLAREGESGFMVRDLRLFQDGHYYLPALSLPFVGRQIAQRHGAPLDEFWSRHFAGPVGRSKAEVFARYGMWYETPNPQNVVIQLDTDLHPTGRIVFRDVGDGECATDAFSFGVVPWTTLQSDLQPQTKTSFWAFGESGEHSVAPEVLERWYADHDDAYYGELARWFPGAAPPPDIAPEARLDHWNRILRSAEGQAAVARSFEQHAARQRGGRASR